MANNKPIGVAYSDPALDTGTTITGATITASSVAATTLTSTTAPTTSDSSGAIALNAAGGVYVFSTAITANSTTTSLAAGNMGITTNATGRGKLFYSDGTKWQFMAIS